MKTVAIITKSKNFIGGVDIFNQYLERVLIENNYSIDYITADNVTFNLKNRILKLLLNDIYFTAKRFHNTKKKYDLIITNGEYCFRIPSENTINVCHNSLWGYYEALKGILPLKNKLSLLRSHYFYKYYSKNTYNVAVSNFTKMHMIQSGMHVDEVIFNCVDIKGYLEKDLYLWELSQMVAIGKD